MRLYDTPPQPRRPAPHTAHDTFMRLPVVHAEQPRDDGEVYFSSAEVVDSRINYSDDGSRRFVEYKLMIDTHSRGVLCAWHRYSVFLHLASTLQLRDGYRRSSVSVPRLPSKKLFGNFTETTISERFEKLNEFLSAATGAEFCEWGIRMDDGTCAYKRIAKTTMGARDSMTSNASTATTGSSPRRRFSLRTFSFRRASTAE